MRIKKLLVILVAALLILAVFPSAKAYAESRNPAISGPATAYLGNTFSVTIGFTPQANTRSCNFSLSYDNNLIQLTGVSNVSGMAGEISLPSDNLNNVKSPFTLVFFTTGMKSVANVVSLSFKVIGKGSVTITVSNASDGEESNTVSGSASRTITLTDPPPTTTTTPRTTTTTTPRETQPHHPGGTVIGKRYDGVDLSVSVSLPDDEAIPGSYVPAEVEWGDKYLEGYESATLPYTLYWLTDEEGGDRFYLYDGDTSVFVPYLRTGWSSRFYTFTVIPEELVPQGFELVTIKVWEKEVPGYKAVEGTFASKAVYDQLLSLTQQGEEAGELSGEALALPEDLYLIAVRINDAEEKVLCLYDAVLDSLIRSNLWLVPVPGSFLDPDYQPRETDPAETAPLIPTDTTPPDPESFETEGMGGTISLFGMDLPLYLVAGTGTAILLILALAVWFFIRAKRAAEFEPDLMVADLEEDDDSYFKPVAAVAPPLVASEPEVEASGPEEVTGGVQEEAGNGWEELKETLFGREEKEVRPPGRRPPEIRPSIHRRPERDDPGDVEEL